MILSTLCYIKQNGHTLFLKRSIRENDIHFGKYNGLGGKMLAGESPKDCVIREVLEESGLEITHPVLRGVLMFPAFKDSQDWLSFLYVCDTFKGEQRTRCPEGFLEWVKDEHIPSLPLWQGDHLFLDWLKKDCFFSAKFVYKDKLLIDHQVDFYKGSLRVG